MRYCDVLYCSVLYCTVPGVGEGEGDVALGHAAVVDGHAAVLAEVAGGHRRHRQAEVPLDATFGSRVCQSMSQFLLTL